MVGEFFIRFNLQNSVCSYPASFDVLRPLVDISDAELTAVLDKIENMHDQRVLTLTKSYEKEIAALSGKKVLFLGDSITSDNFGYRRTVTKAAKLNALDGSVSGGTSSTILHSSRLQINSFSPDIISIMIGTNDSVSVDRAELYQTGKEEYARNVSAILDWSLRSGASVLLFEIAPIHEERFARSFTPQFKLQSNDNVLSYNRILKGVADEYGVPLFSHKWMENGSADELFEQDGIHLSVKGHELFAKYWLSAATKIINTKE